jgi:hypothetical protein
VFPQLAVDARHNAAPAARIDVLHVDERVVLEPLRPQRAGEVALIGADVRLEELDARVAQQDPVRVVAELELELLVVDLLTRLLGLGHLAQQEGALGLRVGLHAGQERQRVLPDRPAVLFRHLLHGDGLLGHAAGGIGERFDEVLPRVDEGRVVLELLEAHRDAATDPARHARDQRVPQHVVDHLVLVGDALERLLLPLVGGIERLARLADVGHLAHHVGGDQVARLAEAALEVLQVPVDRELLILRLNAARQRHGQRSACTAHLGELERPFVRVRPFPLARGRDVLADGRGARAHPLPVLRRQVRDHHGDLALVVNEDLARGGIALLVPAGTRLELLEPVLDRRLRSLRLRPRRRRRRRGRRRGHLSREHAGADRRSQRGMHGAARQRAGLERRAEALVAKRTGQPERRRRSGGSGRGRGRRRNLADIRVVLSLVHQPILSAARLRCKRVVTRRTPRQTSAG